MKRLYIALVILIIAFIGINACFGNLNILNFQTAADDAEGNNATIGNTNLPELNGFKINKINDTAANFVNSDKDMVIKLLLIDNSKDISEIAKSSYSNSNFTSNQTFDQNGVPVYLLYDESSDSYNSKVFFSKDKQNYMLTGVDMEYEDSDYFVNSCKNIIDSINSTGSGNSGGYSRW